MQSSNSSLNTATDVHLKFLQDSEQRHSQIWSTHLWERVAKYLQYSAIARVASSGNVSLIATFYTYLVLEFLMQRNIKFL